MIHLRRVQHEVRVEMTPLMDVIFLLLSFFIYSMVLMVRAELLPLQMQQFASGESAKPAPAVTISIDGLGQTFLDRQPIAVEDVVERLQQVTRENPQMVIYLAAEEHGSVDRLPTFLDLYDRLAFAGLDIKLVGRPSEDPRTERP